LWRAAWSEFVPFLDYDVEIRRVICSTNAIESLNARYRRAVRARGHFPTEQAALKCLYLVTRSLDPTGKGRARWAMRWKPALNAFAITFAGRIVPSNGNQPSRPVTPFIGTLPGRQPLNALGHRRRGDSVAHNSRGRHSREVVVRPDALFA
jgi:hypothetical protein